MRPLSCIGLAISVLLLCCGANDVSPLFFDSSASNSSVSANEPIFLKFNTTRLVNFVLECDSKIFAKAFCAPCIYSRFYDVSNSSFAIQYANAGADRGSPEFCVRIESPPVGAFRCVAASIKIVARSEKNTTEPCNADNKPCVNVNEYVGNVTLDLTVTSNQLSDISTDVVGFDTLVVSWRPSSVQANVIVINSTSSEALVSTPGVGQAEIKLKTEFFGTDSKLKLMVSPAARLGYDSVNKTVALKTGSLCFVRVKTPGDKHDDCTNVPLNGLITFTVGEKLFTRDLPAGSNKFQWFAPEPPSLNVSFSFADPSFSAEFALIPLNDTALDATTPVWVFQQDKLVFPDFDKSKASDLLQDLTVSCEGYFERKAAFIRMGVDSVGDRTNASCTLRLERFDARVDQTFNPLSPQSVTVNVSVVLGTTINGTLKTKQNTKGADLSVVAISVTTSDTVAVAHVTSSDGFSGSFQLFVPHRSPVLPEDYSIRLFNDTLSDGGCQVIKGALNCSSYFLPPPELNGTTSTVVYACPNELWLLNKITVSLTGADLDDDEKKAVRMVFNSSLLPAEIVPSQSDDGTSFTAVVPAGNITMIAYDKNSREELTRKLFEVGLNSIVGPQLTQMSLAKEQPFTLTWLTKYDAMKTYLTNFWGCYKLTATSGANSGLNILLANTTTLSTTLKLATGRYFFNIDECNLPYTNLTFEETHNNEVTKTVNDQQLPFNTTFDVESDVKFAATLEFRYFLEVIVDTDSEYDDEQVEDDDDPFATLLTIKINSKKIERSAIKCGGKQCKYQALIACSPDDHAVTFKVKKETHSVTPHEHKIPLADRKPGDKVSVEVKLKKANALSDLFGDNEQLLVVIGLATALVIVVLWCGYQVIRYCQQRARRYRIIDEYADDEDVGLSDFGTRSGSA